VGSKEGGGASVLSPLNGKKKGPWEKNLLDVGKSVNKTSGGKKCGIIPPVSLSTLDEKHRTSLKKNPIWGKTRKRANTKKRDDKSPQKKKKQTVCTHDIKYGVKPGVCHGKWRTINENKDGRAGRKIGKDWQ